MRDEKKPAEVIDIRKLRNRAQIVGAVHAQHETADKEEVEVLVSLFCRVVEEIGPALPALSSRIVVSEAGDWSACSERTHALGLTGRGVYLGPEPAGPSKVPPRGDEGVFRGGASFLNETGTITSLVYSGKWDARGYAWRATVNVETIEAAIAGGFDVYKAIAKLVSAIDASYGGNKARRTVDIERRVERVRAALATLLRKE